MNKSQARLLCPVCQASMNLKPCRGKTGKSSLMFICPKNGRHFRAFIADQTYVADVLAHLEGLASADASEVYPKTNEAP